MLKLSTNLANFIARIFALFLAFFIIYILIAHFIKDPRNGDIIFTITIIHFKFISLYLIYIMIALFCFIIAGLLSTLLAINKVLINTDNDTITFIDFFNEQTVYITDIREYFDSLYQSSFKDLHGLLIKTNDDKTIQIVEQNVKSVLELKEYLMKKGIHYAGKRKMEFPFR